MKYPEELFYSKSHEWVKLEGDCAWIGITDFAQDALGDLVYVNLPEVGDEVTAGETFADVFSCDRYSGRDQRGPSGRAGDHQPVSL